MIITDNCLRRVRHCLGVAKECFDADIEKLSKMTGTEKLIEEFKRYSQETQELIERIDNSGEI